MDFEFVLPRIIDAFYVGDYELTVRKSFNIFDYPVQLREIIYKYYHDITDVCYGFEEIYSADAVENDIIQDKDLKYIPTSLIDEAVIETKEFGKLLENDYTFFESLKRIKDNLDLN